jgi:deazaflavin-dependent oxidoreductase (nitroreductase family)
MAAEHTHQPFYLRISDHVWPLTNRLGRAHTYLYRRTGGRVGGGMPGGTAKTLLLDHVGAKSGTLRTTPLLYVEDGENLALIASKGGYPKNPAWFYNLRANPLTYVQVGSERRRVRVRLAEPEEYERLWDLAVADWPTFEAYKARAGREIPILVLEPAA